jgi:Na+/melibiose symporter-like transporter
MIDGMSTERPTTASRESLFRHADFRRLWMGDTVSVLGIQFVLFAIPLMAVTVLDADALQMGILAALESLAFLLIGLPAGAWVDRWRKKRILIAGDLARAVLLLTLPAAWLLGVLSIHQLYAVAFAVGCITVFFDVANQSYLPEIVDPEQISEGNSKLQASQQTAFVVGPAAASFLVRLIGSPLTIGVTSICMALSSLFVSRIRHEEVRADPQQRRPLRTEIAEGLSFVTSHPLLRRIVMAIGTGNFASSAAGALFVLFVVRTLGLSQVTLGVILSVGAAGGILGAVTSERFARLVGEGRAIPVSALLIGLGAFSTPLATLLPPVPTLVVGGLVLSWAVVVYNVTQVSFRQRLCPRPLLGRMNASVRFLVWGPMPVGALLGGVAGQQLGVTTALWIFAGVSLLASLPVLLSPLRGMRDLPRELDALSEA